MTLVSKTGEVLELWSYQHGTVCGAYNLGWDEIQEVRDQFEKEFSLPFLIENDANVAALGERWKGAGEFLLTNVNKEFNR